MALTSQLDRAVVASLEIGLQPGKLTYHAQARNSPAWKGAGVEASKLPQLLTQLHIVENTSLM
jgi:hypothetical protein